MDWCWIILEYIPHKLDAKRNSGITWFKQYYWVSRWRLAKWLKCSDPGLSPIPFLHLLSILLLYTVWTTSMPVVQEQSTLLGWYSPNWCSGFNRESIKKWHKNMGEICSLFLVPVITPTAEFWINWKPLSQPKLQPGNNEQQSRLGLVNAWATFSSIIPVSNLEILHKCKKAVLHIYWRAYSSLKITPRLLANPRRIHRSKEY